MKKFLAIIFCLLPLWSHAQSTANPIQPGFLTTSSCPGGASSCFIPYSSANPLPVGVYGGSSATSGFCLTSNGPGVLATFQACSGGGGGSGTVTSIVIGTGINSTQSPLTTTGTISIANPSATTLGGIQSIAAVTHNFLTSISTSGVPAQAQPATGDLSDISTFNLNTTGTAATNTHTVTSTSANCLTVGPNGATNPTLSANCSVTSEATGVLIVGAAAGGGAAINTTSSGTNEALSISGKGTGVVTLKNGGVNSGSVQATSSSVLVNAGGVTGITVGATSSAFTPAATPTASNSRFIYTGASDTTLTASTEAPSIYFNIGQTRQHATGALTLQRDFRVTGSTHSFVGASTLTDAAAFAIDGPPLGGTNATITNASGYYEPTEVLTNTTNGYGLNITAPTGATNNYAARLIGQIVTGGSTPTIAAGAGTGGTTPTIAGANNGGTVSVTTGASPSASGVVATITYTNPFPNNSAVVLYPANSATALLSGTSMVSAAGTATTFVITAGTVALTGLTAYSWNYEIVGF